MILKSRIEKLKKEIRVVFLGIIRPSCGEKELSYREKRLKYYRRFLDGISDADKEMKHD